jgi:hypothetical protein
MARIDREALTNPERVFVAGTLAEARQVEDLLTGSGVDYVVQVEIFGTTLFGSPRNWAVFCVAAGQATYCRLRLTEAGLGRGVLLEDPPS